MDLHRAGDLAGAESAYNLILRQNPDHPGALQLLGAIASQSGRSDEAVALIGKSLALSPVNAAAHSQLGDALMNLGKTDNAIQAYRDALAIEPASVEALNNIGLAYKACNMPEDAVAAFRDALGLRADLPEVHSNMGDALNCLGRFEESMAVCNEALALRPGYAKAHNNLGIALMGLGRVAEAIDSYRAALDIDSDYTKAHNNLGDALKGRGSLNEAIASFRRAVTLDPEFAEAFANLGVALLDNGRIDAALAAQRQALEVNPEFAPAHSNLMYTMSYGDSFTASDILIESRRWNDRHAAPLAALVRPHGNERDPGRRLRIGYVSPDFRSHSVSHFLEPVIAAHDRGGFEIFCYAEIASPDATTARYRTLADHWRPTVGMTDHGVADLVRSDGIDMLVDLAGHTAGNRLLAFAERPAPVQLSYLGYPGTTGMAAMDYRITDRWADPEATSGADHVETLMRLPGGFLCYGPPEDAPGIADPPAGSAGHISFGSFNNFSKITAMVVGAWAAILRAVPHSRLILKSSSLDLTEAGDRLHDLFDGHGIERRRVDILGRMPSIREHLGLYGKIDIGLDPFPYNGTATTCEALWMGVPVITLEGGRHAARVGASLLSRIGLEELIARGSDDYVGLAVDLAGDLGRLAALRAGMRRRMAACSLIDATTFTGELEAAYRDAWRRWCEGGSVRGRLRSS
jgi:predicted O-linked N-acetylglucosamine transferase (SPINDLY family)